MKLLDGQRALITGAGSGIGKVMAQYFEKESQILGGGQQDPLVDLKT